ncbi:hypothetical protein ACOMHN_040856 [Nucella lapillus]
MQEPEVQAVGSDKGSVKEGSVKDGGVTEDAAAAAAGAGASASGAAQLEPSASRPASRAASATSKSQNEEAGPNASKTNIDEIPPNTSDDNPSANWRNIIAEDPEWSLAVVPELTELNLRIIIDNFANNSMILHDLLPKHQVIVLSRIATTLPLQTSTPLIQDEGYWERCCIARWEVCDISAYGGSWKRLFFERHVQGLIEMFVPDTTDPAELDEILQLAAHVVKKLDIRQLLPPVRVEPLLPKSLDDSSDADSDSEEEKESDHFDFGPVLQVVTELEELHVTYSVRDCGMNFEWKLLKFKNTDCLKLARAVATCSTIKVFRLHRSKVDDEKVRVLINHLLDHPSIEDLDLSCNIISDRGARAVGMFINRSRLVRLNLLDNNIRGPGAMALAHGLIKNSTLKYLNLRHNHLSDEGGQAICRSLMKNSTLVELNLSSNDLGEPTATMLSQALLNNTTLKTLDLSCNKLGADGGKNLREGLEENDSITYIDLRLTECGQEAEYNINLFLFRNQEAARDSALKEREASAPSQRKEADPQAAHRFLLPPDLVY